MEPRPAQGRGPQVSVGLSLCPGRLSLAGLAPAFLQPLPGIHHQDPSWALPAPCTPESPASCPHLSSWLHLLKAHLAPEDVSVLG